MTELTDRFSALFGGSGSLQLLQVWGRVGYVLALPLFVFAFGGFTFRPGGAWGFGRERQTWDMPAFVAMILTLVLIPVAGYIGSGIVLVQGAQTLESLKDMVVIMSVLLFGYPAMIMVAPAYMISDTIEGIPPGWVLRFGEGYFLLAAYLRMGAQLIGTNPDFKLAGTWLRYAIFAVLFCVTDVPMWGFVCAREFTASISYPVIIPALMFTTIISLVMVPFGMLIALPQARRVGLFWADIPGHVKQRWLRHRQWIWESGRGRIAQDAGAPAIAEVAGIPLRVALAGMFIALVVVLIGGVAYLAARSGQDAATLMAGRLHEEISENINLRLDEYLDRSRQRPDADRMRDINQLLATLPIARQGRVLIVDFSGNAVASSIPAGTPDPVAAEAITHLKREVANLGAMKAQAQYRFDVITATPLARDTWLAQATPYSDNSGRVRWIMLTAMPESYYLASLQEGSGRTAMLFAVALTATLLLAALVAGMVAGPMRRIALSAEAMARGDLTQQVEGSMLQELNALVASFNRMARQLRESFAQKVSSEETLKAIFNASPSAMAVFDSAGSQRQGFDPQQGFPMVDVNAAWQKVVGQAPESVTGASTRSLNLWGDVADRGRFIEMIRSDAPIDNFEATLRRVDGRQFAGSMSVSNAIVGDGRLSILAVEDITERKQAAARLMELNQQLTALFDSAASVAIIATDAVGRVTVFNTGAERMLGYSSDEVMGLSVFQFFLKEETDSRFAPLDEPSGVHRMDVFAALTLDGNSNVQDWTFVRRDRKRVQVSMALSAVRDEHGRVTGFLSVARDITAQVAAQQELEQLNRELDLRVRDRTSALEASTAELTSALHNLRQTQDKLINAEKLASLGAIVAGVAHELNTPIGISVTVASTMRSKTDALRRHASEGTLRRSQLDETLEALSDGMVLLQQALDRAHQLVANFKRVSVDQSSEKRRSFRLKQAIDDVAGLTRATFRKTAYTLEVDVPDDLTMVSYPGAIEQIVINLINNSTAHGFAGRDHGTMRISAMAEGQNVHLTYSDDGCGMTPDTLRHVFDPFFTTALGRGGSGLGMTISYNLATGPLAGSIDVASEPGQGCRFALVLPRVAPEGARQRTGAAVKGYP